MKLGFTVATPETLLLHAGQGGVVIAIKPQSRFFINWINSIQEAIDWIRTYNQHSYLIPITQCCRNGAFTQVSSMRTRRCPGSHVPDSNAGRRVGTHRFG
jgi:hypothetical protein